MRLDRRAPAYALFAAAGVLPGLALSQPSLAALGAAFAVTAATALAHRPRLPEVSFDLSADRSIEGAGVEATVALHARDRLDWLELVLILPDRVRLADGARAVVLRLRSGEVRTLSYSLDCPRWGAFSLGGLRLEARQRLGFAVAEQSRAADRALRVYPQLERLRRLVAAPLPRPASGNTPAKAKGDGIEFADLREFRIGDLARRINPRASSRRGELIVTERLPERSSDIVVFLDSLSDARTSSASALDDAVRATASLVHAYLRERDRVGLLSFGGDLTWVLPATGPRQEYRILEAVLASETARMFRWRDIRLIPRRILPPQALVVALTPLLDWRSNRALLNLRSRGYQLAIIEVDPTPYAAASRAVYGERAWQFWLLERDALRQRFAASGARVVQWSPDRPLAAVVEELAQAR